MGSLADLIIGTGEKTASSIVSEVKKPVNTVEMKQQYDAANIEAQSSGEAFPDWPTWLDQQGYSLDSRGLVTQKSK